MCQARVLRKLVTRRRITMALLRTEPEHDHKTSIRDGSQSLLRSGMVREGRLLSWIDPPRVVESTPVCVAASVYIVNSLAFLELD